MANVTATLTIDNPGAYGMMSLYGFGRTWSAAQMVDGSTVRAPKGLRSGLRTDPRLEYIPEIDVLTAFGRIVHQATEVAQFDIAQGALVSTPVTGAISEQMLFGCGSPREFASGSVTAYLDVQTTATWNVGFCLTSLRPWTWRGGDPEIIDVRFGTPGGLTYAIILPLRHTLGAMWGGARTDAWTPNGFDYLKELTGTAGGDGAAPLLLGSTNGAAPWTVLSAYDGGTVEELRGGMVHGQKGGSTDALIVEDAYGYLSINCPTWFKRRWLYAGDWRAANGDLVEWSVPQSGRVRIISIGSTMIFGLKPLAYVSGGAACPTEFVRTPDWVAGTPAFATISEQPAGTSIAVTTEGSGGAVRPRATFTSSGTKRPALRAIQEWRIPVTGAPTSSPVASALGSDLECMNVTGTIDESYRNTTCTVHIATTQATLKAVAMNSWANVDIKLGDDGGSAVRHAFGCVFVPEYSTEAARVEADLQIASADEARLARKFMVWHPSYEGWAIPEWFAYVLHRAGIPDTLIDIDAGITEAALGELYHFPIADDYTRLLQFSDTTSIPDALDMGCKLSGLRWGWSIPTGKCFLRLPAVYSGTPDYTLDLASATPRDLAKAIKSGGDPTQYINWGIVIAGKDQGRVLRQLRDEASISALGDAWYGIEEIAEGEDPEPVLAAMWARRHGAMQTMHWQMVSHAELMPGMHVKVKATSLKVPSEAIYRITRKAYSANADSYTQDLDAVFVQEAPPV